MKKGCQGFTKVRELYAYAAEKWRKQTLQGTNVKPARRGEACDYRSRSAFQGQGLCIDSERLSCIRNGGPFGPSMDDDDSVPMV